MAAALPSDSEDHPYYNTYFDPLGDPSEIFGFVLNICTDGAERKAYKQCRNAVTFAQVAGRWVNVDRTTQTVISNCKMCDRNGRNDIFIDIADMGTAVRNLITLMPELTTVVYTVTSASGARVQGMAQSRGGGAEPATHMAQAQASPTCR